MKYVKEQTLQICLAAIRRIGDALQDIKEQTPEICLAAVQQNGYALRYVKDFALKEQIKRELAK